MTHDRVRSVPTTPAGQPRPGRTSSNDAGRAAEQAWQKVLPLVERLASRFASAAARLSMTRDDLMQEAWVKFAAVFPRFDGRPGGLIGWTNRVLRNHFAGLLRCRRPSQTAAVSRQDGDTVADLPDEQAAVLEQVVRREVQAAVRDVCRGLVGAGHSPQEMKAFRLRWFCGRRLADIATVLGRSVSWTHGAIERTLRAFARSFARRHPGLLDNGASAGAGQDGGHPDGRRRPSTTRKNSGMRIAYLSHDEVNLDLMTRMAGREGIEVVSVWLRDPTSSEEFDAVVCDLDSLPRSEQTAILDQLIPSTPLPRAVHSFNLDDGQAEELGRHGVVVFRRFDEQALRAIRELCFRR